MTPEERDQLDAARRDLPRLAIRHGSKTAVAEAFRALYPDVVAGLGDVLLGRWCWDQLRAMKEEHDAADGEQLPLFGAFRDEITPRSEWDESRYLAYWRRYRSMADHGTAKLSLLTTEFADRFGCGPEEWQRRQAAGEEQ